MLAFGKDVVEGGGTGFEVCTVAATCKSGAQGGLGGELTEPTGVAVDGSGNIYVDDADSHRVERFDSSGHFMLAFGKDVDSSRAGTGFEICTVAANCQPGTPGALPGELDFPQGIATDATGDVYVSDLENARIEKFEPSGKLLRVIGTGGAHGGEFSSPWGVFTDAAGDLYAADPGNHRIQELADPPPAGGSVGGGATVVPGATTGGQPGSVAPHILRGVQSHSTWRLAGGHAASAKHRRLVPVGTKFSFVLDQAAKVNIAFVQKVSGRELAGHCVALGSINRRGPGCRRQVTVARLSLTGKSGENQLTFQGRLSRSRRLRPGRYTVLITATNASGQRSAVRSLSFRIVS